MTEGKYIPLWKVRQIADLLYTKGVRYFLTFYRDGVISVVSYTHGNFIVKVPYTPIEWQAVLDNLEQLEYGSVYADMAGGKLVLYALPQRGLKLSDEILEAMKS